MLVGKNSKKRALNSEYALNNARVLGSLSIIASRVRPNTHASVAPNNSSLEQEKNVRLRRNVRLTRTCADFTVVNNYYTNTQ